MKEEARKQLEFVAEDVLRHFDAGTVRLEPEIGSVESSVYTDPERFDREREHIFRNLPLMLAMSCELEGPGSYKALQVAGTPVLIVRGKDGTARAFLNACSHRGAILDEDCGKAARFTCPYHGWTFGREGELLGVAYSKIFGEADRGSLGLKPFPTFERAGMIWVILNEHSKLDVSAFLQGYDDMLEGFGFENWRMISRRVLNGPNWKLCFDAHLEFYHIPVLHKDSFGSIDPRTLYYNYGPHQRLARPSEGRNGPDNVDIFQMRDRASEDLPDESLMFGEWIMFPNVSINTFYAGGRGVIVSQVIPGETVDQSETIQLFLLADEPDVAGRNEAAQTADFLAKVVGEEDLPTSLGQQTVMRSGAMDRILFGRNEGGLQQFHSWVERIVSTPFDDLPSLFASARGVGDKAAMFREPESVPG
ncbi:aromatic ring-hydroxylating dioxygenase subunit alpha [Novosphingobium tardum]|uniref:Aromatic ring-hydroxylating dioxygenase subunit alpha n=1 Tax=Novosphingobium tardum TaxID=1538021 RepID=A0ABV8RPI4_9SPHN